MYGRPVGGVSACSSTASSRRSRFTWASPEPQRVALAQAGADGGRQDGPVAVPRRLEQLVHLLGGEHLQRAAGRGRHLDAVARADGEQPVVDRRAQDHRQDVVDAAHRRGREAAVDERGDEGGDVAAPQRGQRSAAEQRADVHAQVIVVARPGRGAHLQRLHPALAVRADGHLALCREHRAAGRRVDPGLRQRVQRLLLGAEPSTGHPAVDPVGDLPRGATAVLDPAGVGHRALQG